MGIAKITATHWSVIQPFNLSQIIAQYQALKIKTNKLSLTINDSTLNAEYSNSLVSLHALEKRIENLLIQIVPYIHESRRKKRGLFNPLGSFIKAITGNLDQTDAEEIYSKIEILQTNQNKIKASAIHQISIIESTIDQFQKIVANLTHNELILKSRIMQIEAIFKTSGFTGQDLRAYFMTFTIINQMTLMYQSIYSVLNKIEIAITFAKLNTLHNSIIDPKGLLYEMKNLESKLETYKFPLPIESENVLALERIITIKCFQKDLNIIFIMELPLVEQEVYQYYNVFPLLIPSKKSFYVNIPHKPYLAISETKYAFMEAECREMQSNEFLCPSSTYIRPIDNNPPCEIQLLRHMPNITTCSPFKVHLEEPQAVQVVEGKWILTIPTQLVITSSCPNSKETIPLFGSYLVEVPELCKLQVQSLTLETFKTSKFPFEEAVLPKLNFEEIETNHRRNYTPPSIDLDSINLQTTLDLKSKLELQKETLQDISSNVYVSRTSIWTILLYILCAVSVSYLVLRKCLKVRESLKRQNDPQEEIF